MGLVPASCIRYTVCSEANNVATKKGRASICTLGWAAQELGISVEYVRVLMKQGKLEQIPVEGHLYIVTVESVEKLKKAREAKASE